MDMKNKIFGKSLFEMLNDKINGYDEDKDEEIRRYSREERDRDRRYEKAHDVNKNTYQFDVYTSCLVRLTIEAENLKSAYKSSAKAFFSELPSNTAKLSSQIVSINNLYLDGKTIKQFIKKFKKELKDKETYEFDFAVNCSVILWIEADDIESAIEIYEKTPDSELMPRSTVEVYSKSFEVIPIINPYDDEDFIDFLKYLKDFSKPF